MPPTTVNPTIARLAALCRESGLTRRDIAERAGLRPPYLTRMLSGEFIPSVEIVASVLTALGCTWADLDADKP